MYDVDTKESAIEAAESFSTRTRESKKVIVAMHVANRLIPCSKEWRPANRRIRFDDVPFRLPVVNLTIEIMKRLAQTVPDDRQKVFASIEAPEPQDGVQKKGAPIAQHEKGGTDAETWLRLRGLPVPDRSDLRKAAGRLRMMEVM